MDDPRPTSSAGTTVAELEQQERDLVLPSFSPDTAWRLGSLLTERARRENLPLAIDIRRPGFILFRASLAGTTADHEEWLRRKSAVVLRFECSSALMDARTGAAGVDWLDPADYAVTGGSFPLRVRDAGVIGAMTASGLTSAEDHRLVVETLAEYLAD